ncbi:hypothetical protein NC652_024083 [Populus alba x Populus x berolinensis]|uniref:Uncharacterized protein n=1 Tax=Populus alba x Populus x berolinensis TaxID=444605 RepID=A0AAD6QB35_9ROSI|nr:hypothetical protein NC652_024083 [Populus alba x Populus x berolinensis]KAJ6985944.1 hypothetical protein NC653_023770 [Populus alba x Populus x berolinensis]
MEMTITHGFFYLYPDGGGLYQAQ